MKTTKNYSGILLVILVVTVIIIALSLVTMLLWNWIMPGIILCDRINVLQAMGLFALISLLTFDKSKLFNWLYE
jgi:ABC-type bacteriocin/lantibiotic exporter with double-glycine peptidase domain